MHWHRWVHYFKCGSWRAFVWIFFQNIHVNVPTWLCHRYVPNKISACVPVCCTQLRRRRQSTRSPWRPCSTGCCGTGVPGSRKPTRVADDSSELFCQPCSDVFCLEAMLLHSPTRRAVTFSPVYPLSPLSAKLRPAKDKPIDDIFQFRWSAQL